MFCVEVFLKDFLVFNFYAKQLLKVNDYYKYTYILMYVLILCFSQSFIYSYEINFWSQVLYPICFILPYKIKIRA